MPFDLDQTFYLARAGRYANPDNTNDRLPLVYGDLTSGNRGVWVLPFIDTVNDIYCFADHETLSVANGNNITIYADGVTVNPANYAFDESNNVESQGVISTITFSTPPAENAVIAAKGKGKHTSVAATLMTSVVDIIDDLLITETALLSSLDFEATRKAKSSNVFIDQSYAAAGVLDSDFSLWTTLIEMVSSFRGSIYVNAQDKLVIDIDDGTLNVVAPDAIIRKGDITFGSARVRSENLINRVPANYAYDYVNGEFASHTDASAQADTASANIYGERKPPKPYQFRWTRDINTVNTVQSIIVTQQKSQDKIREISFTDNTLRTIKIDIGDIILGSFNNLFDREGQELINEYLKVLSINNNLNKDSISYRVLDTGFFLTTAHIYDGSITYNGDHLYGGERDLTEL